jgi:hypothetical protein
MEECMGWFGTKTDPTPAIYETSILGISIKVYPDRVEYRDSFMSPAQSIPIDQIASIRPADILNKLRLETTGGREIVLVTGRKKEVADAIFKAKSMRSQGPHSGGVSVADELEKLVRLRNQGVLTDAEFESQKRKLLG